MGSSFKKKGGIGTEVRIDEVRNMLSSHQLCDLVLLKKRLEAVQQCASEMLCPKGGKGCIYTPTSLSNLCRAAHRETSKRQLPGREKGLPQCTTRSVGLRRYREEHGWGVAVPVQVSVIPELPTLTKPVDWQLCLCLWHAFRDTLLTLDQVSHRTKLEGAKFQAVVPQSDLFQTVTHKSL